MKKSANLDDTIKLLDGIKGKRTPPLPDEVEDFILELAKHFVSGRWNKVTQLQFIEILAKECVKRFGVEPTKHQLKGRIQGARRA